MKKDIYPRAVYVLSGFEAFIIGVLLISFGVVGTLVYGMMFNTEKVDAFGVLEGLMFETNNGGIANGFYSTSGYFCVSTRGRSVEEVTRTTVHELAHFFVDSDYEHFCKPQLEGDNI